MDEELKKALADLGVNTVAEAGKKAESAVAALRTEFEANEQKRDAVNDEKLAKINAELDKVEKVNEIVTALEAQAKATAAETQERMDALEARLNRPGAGGDTDIEAANRAKAFEAFARKGNGALTGDYQNVLQVADDSAAGVLAHPELVMSILKEIEEFSPMRNQVTVRTTSKESVQQPKRNSLPDAVWVGETEDRPDTEGLGYGMLDIPVHEATMSVPVSNKMLEDADFNLMDEIREAVSIAFGKQEGRAIISGDAFKKPQGILNASGVVGVNTGTAATITADALINLKYALKTGYAQQGSYVLNRQTLGKVRVLKDGNGQYLWASGLAAGRANTIDGEPYVEMPDMPNVGAGLKPVAFGDWKRGYTLVDRLAMSMLRDDYTRAGNGQVLFRWRRRLGGAVSIAEAIAVLTVQE